MEVADLKPREKQVLIYTAKGFTMREIADLMGIGRSTVNDHRKSIYKQLEVGSSCEAAVLAAKAGLV